MPEPLARVATTRTTLAAKAARLNTRVIVIRASRKRRSRSLGSTIKSAFTVRAAESAGKPLCCGVPLRWKSASSRGSGGGAEA